MGTRSPAGPVTIALDALGAERGAGAVAEAVESLAREGISLRLFGRAAELEPALRGLASNAAEIVDTDQLIGNDEDPVAAVRSGPGTSIVRAAAAVAEGVADALVSPGSTGATLAAATFALKRAAGVQRPALAVQLPAPGLERPVVLLDAGANSEARSSHLVQFAHLGSAFASVVLGIDRPRVALLSVGTEAKKGTPALVEAHQALRASATIRFTGNVEGTELLSGTADVIVTDGFTGNVALKTIEGTARTVGGAVRQAARSGPAAMLGGLLLRRSLGDLRAATDPDATGGAIMLGLRRPAVVAHGSAGPDGIANAVRLAARAVRERMTERTAAALEAGSAGRVALRDRKS